jgi:hypothetical protein
MTVSGGASGKARRQVEIQIGHIESSLLGTSDGPEACNWLKPTAVRLRNLFNGSRQLREEFKDWLGLTLDGGGSPDGSSSLSEPVLVWLGSKNSKLRLRNRAEALRHLQSLQDSTNEGEACMAVVLGLQYVVLEYLPGLLEFRGSYSQSNLLPEKTLVAVRNSVRVPYRRGAVNWMTALQQGKSIKVVTLDDAAFDLRGRVAAEDLVSGNRSVCGFAVQDPVNASIVGYFFVSHPVPGLFGRGKDSLEKRLGQLRDELEDDLSAAIQADLIGDFARHTLHQSRRWDQRWRPELGAPPVMSLASDSPTGFLAALRTRRVKDPVSRAGGNSNLDCQINEGPLITNSIWPQLQLTCAFFDDWADPIARHMQSFAELLEARVRHGGDGAGPRMAWIPQHRESVSTGAQASEKVAEYYPFGVLSDLDRWSVGTLGNWLNWHEHKVRTEDDQPEIKTSIHRRLAAALSIYSGRESSYADLVVPILGHAAGEPHPRVVAFLRFNCAPGVAPGSGKHSAVSDDRARFRQLYHIVQRYLAALDRSVGALLAATDRKLRSLLSASDTEPPIRIFKQATDAARVLADWIVAYLASMLSEAAEGQPDFTIVRYVYGHLLESDLPSLERVLADVQAVVRDLGEELKSEASAVPEVPVITFWLQTSQPAIKIIRSDQSPEEGSQSLADLLIEDPGLPQLLFYLSYTLAWRKQALEEALDLRKRLRIGVEGLDGALHVLMEEDPVREVSHVLDLGVAPTRDKFTQLVISNATTVGDNERLSLRWQKVHQNAVREIELEWHWARSPEEARFHPFPAAVRPVPLKVSRRVGAVIAEDALVQVSEHLTGESDHPISIEAAFDEVAQPFRDKIKALEDAMLGPSDDPQPRACWQPIRVTAEEHLLMLAPREESISPLVEVVRNLALSYERGAHLAWVLGAEHYEREALTAQLAAVAHGYAGPLANLRHELTMAQLRWSEKEHLERGEVLDSMKAFLYQASAIIRLAEAAIIFSRREVVTPPKLPLTGRVIATELGRVIAAYQPRRQGIISTEIDDDLQGSNLQAELVDPELMDDLSEMIDKAVDTGRQPLGQFVSDLRAVIETYQARKRVLISTEISDDSRRSQFQAELAAPLLFHGFSKLIDNAVNAARRSPGITAHVQLRCRLTSAELLIEVSNTGYALSEDKFAEIAGALQSGKLMLFDSQRELRPHLGLHEAWQCFSDLGIGVDVQRGTPPFVLCVTLKLVART